MCDNKGNERVGMPHMRTDARDEPHRILLAAKPEQAHPVSRSSVMFPVLLLSLLPVISTTSGLIFLFKWSPTTPDVLGCPSPNCRFQAPTVKEMLIHCVSKDCPDHKVYQALSDQFKKRKSGTRRADAPVENLSDLLQKLDMGVIDRCAELVSGSCSRSACLYSHIIVQHYVR